MHHRIRWILLLFEFWKKWKVSYTYLQGRDFFFFFRKDQVEENKNKNNMLCGSTDASTSIDLPEHSSYLAYSRTGSDSFQSDTFYAIAI